MLEFLNKEWEALKCAPRSFVCLTLLSLGFGFSGGVAFRGQELANLESLLRLRDGEIDGYKKSIDDRLNKVEKELSQQQLSSIESVLKALPSRVSIQKGTKTSESFTKQIKNAFSASGWDVKSVENPDAQQNIILRAPNREAGGAIAKALESARINYESVYYTDAAGVIDFHLATPQEK